MLCCADSLSMFPFALIRKTQRFQGSWTSSGDSSPSGRASQVRAYLVHAGETGQIYEVPETRLRRELGEPETQRERDAVEFLPFRIGGKGLVETPDLVVLVGPVSDEVENELAAADARLLACHDHMDVCIPRLTDPRDPVDLRPVVGAVAAGAPAVEEDPRHEGQRSRDRILGGFRGLRGILGHCGSGEEGEQNEPEAKRPRARSFSSRDSSRDRFRGPGDLPGGWRVAVGEATHRPSETGTRQNPSGWGTRTAICNWPDRWSMT